MHFSKKMASCFAISTVQQMAAITFTLLSPLARSLAFKSKYELHWKDSKPEEKKGSGTSKTVHRVVIISSLGSFHIHEENVAPPVVMSSTKQCLTAMRPHSFNTVTQLIVASRKLHDLICIFQKIRHYSVLPFRGFSIHAARIQEQYKWANS